MSLSNRCHIPLRINGTTLSPGTLEGTQVGEFNNSSTRAAVNNSTLLPNQPIIDLLDQASALIPSDVYPSIVANGGGTNVYVSSKSASGWAVNVQLVRQGSVLLPADNASLYIDFISGLIGNSLLDNRFCAIGLYNWGIYFDQLESRQIGIPGVVALDESTITDTLDQGISQGKQRADSKQIAGEGMFLNDGSSGGELNPQAFENLSNPSASNAAIEIEKQKQTSCNPANDFNRNKSTGGTAVSGIAVAATHSILKNQGLQIPASLVTATNTYESCYPIGLNEEIINLLRDAPNYETPATIHTFVSSTTELLMHTGVRCKLNGLTGRMTGSTAGIIDGNLNNVISKPIIEIANNVLGNGNLAKFCNIFSSALGAAGSATGMGQSLSQIQGQVFGNAREKSSNSLGPVPGFEIDKIAGGRYTNLIGKQESVLPGAVKDNPVAMFGTAYHDMNSMVTQGLGSLSSDITSTGRDLMTLGKLANLEDLFRIGTPGQIVEQLVIHGATATQKIIAPMLVSKGLSVSTINQPSNDSLAKSILFQINSKDLIDNAFQVLGIKRNNNVTDLGVLLDPTWLFPNSKDSNRFVNLNEISLHISILGELTISTLDQLGALLFSMETISSESGLLDEVQPMRLEENIELKREATPTSEYSGDSNLTIADFIGTAAGYRVTETLPQIANFINQLTAAGTLDCYTDLLEYLRDTLRGDYTFGVTTFTDPSDPLNQITLPAGIYLTDPTPATATYAQAVAGLDPIVACGKYSLGYYANIDDALLDLHNYVETELDFLYNNSTGDNLEKLIRIQGLHDEVNYQLYKEQKLRKTYGLDIGFSEIGVELFAGNGTQSEFKLMGIVDSDSPNITVYVSGIKLSSGQINYDSQKNTVTLTSIPPTGSSVEIIYNTGNFPVTGNIRDIWGFTSSLETYAVETGFGHEADFIQRLLAPDMHGGRIKSAMLQGRNKERASTYGLEPIEYNRVNSTFNDENPNSITTITETNGLWSDDPSRAAEIYVQNRANVETREEYIAYQIKKNKSRQQDSFDDIMTTVCRKLIFHSGGYVGISNQLANFYNVYKESFRNRKFNTSDVFKISLDENYPDSGFVIGPYKQIISEILRNESIEDFVFDVPLSEQAKIYLKSIDIDIRILTAMIQKIMIVNAANYLGIIEDDARNIFNIPGAGKYIVRAIVNQL